MADERRIFPTETVLELVAGKKDADTSALAGYLLGRPLASPVSAMAAAPFAAAWLCRWYPKFSDLDWKEGEDWNQFVNQAKARLGDNISLSPISGSLKKFGDAVLDALKDSHESLMRQTDAAAKLEQRVRELEPLEKAFKTLQKKNDETEEKLKTMKSDMGSLQRQVNGYQGKLAIDNNELMQTIKDAIKDGLKGLSVSGAATAGTAAALAEAETQPLVDSEDEFGFGSSKNSDDEFGF